MCHFMCRFGLEGTKDGQLIEMVLVMKQKIIVFAWVARHCRDDRFSDTLHVNQVNLASLAKVCGNNGSARQSGNH